MSRMDVPFRAGFLAIAAVALLFGLTACSAEEAAEPDVTSPTVEQAAVEPTAEEPMAAEPTEAEAAAPEQAPVEGALLFVVQPEQSFATYTVDEEFFSGAVERLGRALGFTQAVGRAGGLGGELRLDLDGEPSVAGGNLTVDLRGLATDDERRDKRVREDYLQSDMYPNAEFVVTGAEGLPAAYEDGSDITFTLLGDLTIREVSMPVAWDVRATVADGALTGTATTTINMSDFGITPPDIANMMKVEDAVTLTADIVANAMETQ